MGYTINVAKNGKHYFSTNEESLTYTKQAEDAFKDIKARFPEGEGYEVSIFYIPSTSYGCYLDEGGNLINNYIKSK